MHPKRPEELIEDGSFIHFAQEFGDVNIKNIPLKVHGKWAHAKELTELLALHRKAAKKIPDLLKILPALDKRSLEQCTSEAVAMEKAKLMGTGTSLLNLSGGLGIDDLALSRLYEHIYSIDNNADLNRMVRYNLEKIGLTGRISRIDCTAEEWLQKNPDTIFDCIYADPDRRVGGHKADPAAHEPDVLALMSDLLRRSPQVWVKFSPLLDTQWLANLNNASEIWCIALENEMKEVLMKFEHKPSSYVLFGSIHILGSDVQKFTHISDKNMVIEEDPVGNWIYLPNVALMHSRLSFHYARNLGVKCVSRQGQVFCSEHLFSGFQGRVYMLNNAQIYKPSLFSAYLKRFGIKALTFITRGTSLDVQRLKKQHKIQREGSDIMLFTRAKGKDYVLHLSEKRP